MLRCRISVGRSIRCIELEGASWKATVTLPAGLSGGWYGEYTNIRCTLRRRCCGSRARRGEPGCYGSDRNSAAGSESSRRLRAVDHRHSPEKRQNGEPNMRDASSTDVKLRRNWRRREEERRRLKRSDANLKVWRDEGTNEIVIAPPLFASAAGSRRAYLSLGEARATSGKFAPPFRSRNGIESDIHSDGVP